MSPVWQGVNVTSERRPHPAAFPENILAVLRTVVPKGPVLDPFGGVGRLALLGPEWSVTIQEIEAEWAEQAASNGCCVVHLGDSSVSLPSPLHPEGWDDRWPCICTSPTYGNRMADHDASQLRAGSGENLKASDGVRASYTAKLGRKLTPGNSGEMYFANRAGRDPLRTGEAYKDLHRKVWRRCWESLQPGGLLIVNLKDAPGADSVCEWHKDTLEDIGFVREQRIEVPVRGDRNTHRMRAKGLATVDFEEICVWRKPRSAA
jgi:hypothetical protein